MKKLSYLAAATGLALLLGCGGGAPTTAPSGPPPEMTLSAYKAQRPEGGARVAANCRISGHDDDLLRLTLEDRSDFIFVWGEKDSPLGKQFMDVLKDGERHRLVLDICPADSGKDTILRLVKK